MQAGYTPGAIDITELSISSQRGSVDLKRVFVSGSVFETIFHPGTVAQITVLDFDDLIGKIKFVGDETVNFSFKAPGGQEAKFVFAVHTVEDTTLTSSAMKSKMYKINCVPKEALQAQTNYIQKNYKTTISNIVKDIHKNFLKSDKPLEVEETKGDQKVLIPSYNPFKAIDSVRRRAVSNQNKSSSFIFFETRKGSNQIYKFSTIEQLFKGSVVKTFKQLNTLGNDLYSLGHDNIIAYEIPKQFDSVDRIRVGGKRRVAQFNYRTWDYKAEDKKPDSKSFKTGGNSGYDSSQFKSEYYDAPKNAPLNLIPVDSNSGERPNTGIPQMIADQQVYIATLMQNTMKIRVPGDSKLKAGDMIEAKIPVKESSTSNKKDDPMLSGKFLISRIHHQILTAAENPRYTCVIELIKGNPEEGV